MNFFSVDGKFAWYDEKATDATLFDVNIQIPRGKLTIVVGSIGSGKSSLLASILGETNLIGGELHWLAENAYGYGYVPSDPWILNVSLRENITFGRPYEERRYDEVVKATCLQGDIDLLPVRDLTVIGERGAQLSGGKIDPKHFLVIFGNNIFKKRSKTEDRISAGHLLLRCDSHSRRLSQCTRPDRGLLCL